MVYDTGKEPGTSKLDPIDVRKELEQLDVRIAELKVTYEQHFSGIVPLAPVKQHTEVKRLIRRLHNAPFKNSELNFRLRTIENRYRAFNTYWERVLREKEAGTYSRDIFKAELREKVSQDESYAQTQEGAAERQVRGLFDAYKDALEKHAGSTMKLDYKSFHQSLVSRAKEIQEKTGAKKLSFKLTVKGGKVSVQVKAKEEKE